MAMEALRTQLDSLRWEKQQLDVENARLREANPGTAALADAEAEETRLQKEAAHLQEEATQIRARNKRLLRELAQVKTVYEQLLRDS